LERRTPRRASATGFARSAPRPVVRLSARSAQSGRHPLRREWRDGQPADGAVRVEDEKMALYYTKKANRKKLAADAGPLMLR